MYKLYLDFCILKTSCDYTKKIYNFKYNLYGLKI